MTEENKNMKLWNQVCVTDKKWTKEVKIGARKYTTISAYKQIRRATELWGSFCGEGWGVKNEKFESMPSNVALYTATLYYPGGEVCIHSDTEIVHMSGKRKGQYNEDWTKKIATDALTKGLSKLGFSADIFQNEFNSGNANDNKYQYQERKQYEPSNQQGNFGKTLTLDQITHLKDLIKENRVPIDPFFKQINANGTKFFQFEIIPSNWYDSLVKIIKGWKS